LFGVVAFLAGPLAVGRTRRSAVGVVFDVVEVADRGVAPLGAAASVPEPEELGEFAVEEPATPFSMATSSPVLER